MDTRETMELQQMRENVKSICAEYGLYGNVYHYQPSRFENSDCNGLYIVAGTDPSLAEEPLPKNLRPDVIERREGQSELLFHPQAWALNLSEQADHMHAIDKLVDYCKKTELLASMYTAYDLPLPEKIRYSEIETLRKYHSAMTDPHMSYQGREKLQKDMDWFFKREKSTGFRRRWLDYFRSDKFPDDAGPIAKLRGYFKRNSSVVPLSRLMEVNGDVQKLQMQEFEYPLFIQYLNECFPDVTVSIGKKDIVNHGVDKPGTTVAPGQGRRITQEEWACTIKDRFATEGWECVKDVKPSYWEYRDVYYKEIDEAQIATAYQAITLPYAQDNDLGELNRHGNIEMISINEPDFMNFVHHAKINGVRFFIDKHGMFAKPSLKKVHVIYNSSQRDLVANIPVQIISDKVSHSHLVGHSAQMALEAKIHAAELTPRTSNHQLKQSERSL